MRVVELTYGEGEGNIGGRGYAFLVPEDDVRVGDLYYDLESRDGGSFLTVTRVGSDWTGPVRRLCPRVEFVETEGGSHGNHPSGDGR